MTRLFAVLVVLLGLSACDYSSRSRTATAPVQSKADISNSLAGVGTQPPQ
jgi:hypothetical protein